jgi:hypothetical protein
MSTRLWSPVLHIVVLIGVVSGALAQTAPETAPPTPERHALETENADQVAKVFGISDLVNRARGMRAESRCDAPPTIEELSMRQDIVETLLAGSFEVDGVLAELDNERAHLSELSAALQARRDRAVNLTNVAGLVTGSGLGIAVNAMQFSSSTANIGNGIGVGSGIASTVLSIIGIHLQRGPQRSVGRIPNMLAPLFARQSALSSYYPQPVLDYLGNVPPGEGADKGSRLNQLMADWQRFGRVGQPGSLKTDQKITRLTSSLDDKTKLSIDDLSDRFAMLTDVAGRVALMKRDLADLMLSLRRPGRCSP